MLYLIEESQIYYNTIVTAVVESITILWHLDIYVYA